MADETVLNDPEKIPDTKRPAKRINLSLSILNQFYDEETIIQLGVWDHYIALENTW